MFLSTLTIFLAGSLAFVEAQNAVCSAGSACIPIRDCPEVRSLARVVKTTKEESKKIEILNTIKSKLCGERKKDFTVCCDSSTIGAGSDAGDQDAVAPGAAGTCETGQEIGNIRQLTFHELSGRVVVKDPQTLLLCNFRYDGEGPDAFLIVGNAAARDTPNADDAIPILPPSNTKAYNFNDKTIPILRRYNGQTLELRVPEGETAYSLKWISLFCRDYNIDFGHAKLNQDVPKRS